MNKIVAYFRVREGDCPVGWLTVDEQRASLPDGEVVKRFYEREPTDCRLKLKKAIKIARERDAILAIPLMIRHTETLEILRDSGVTVWPNDPEKVLRRHLRSVKRRTQSRKLAMRERVAAGEPSRKSGGTRDTTVPGKVSAARRREEANKFYRPIIPKARKLREKGWSFERIAQELNEQGYVTLAGKPFTFDSVSRMMKRDTKS